MVDRALRAARVATFVYFVLNGTLLGVWVVQIPAIETKVGIGHAVLGGLLVVLGAGAFAGMQLAGPLSDRFGPRAVVPAAGALCAAALVLPGLAHDTWTLGGALLVLGFFNGCLDVSMNAHAVQVEKAYGRPVMSAFHATFSVGGVLAALLGAGATGLGWSPARTLTAVAVAGVLVAVVTARGLLSVAPAPEAGGEPPAGEAGSKGTGRRAAPARIWFLAALALMVMLSEGVANDWSALHLRTVLGASESSAAFAYGTYAATMTLGRLLADRFSARFGSVAVLRYGSALAAAGIGIVAVSPWIPLALAGWALFGLGLSGTVPQLFSAAGHADPAAAGANVSRVAGLGYLGMLAGPALIGWMTHVVALNHAFLLPAALCLVAAFSAGALRPRVDRSPDPEPGRESARETAGEPVRPL
ncbi:MFS transporter [Streptomyces griseoaurantiacus]|uniref:MFS transporter n=1 Tax=Streptomyces griseoaurantiacus TaxID=68213 RepID=A0A7W2DXC4_9ACTN|nr:MFS transporter [Streptomyces griseoaurantiacus]MBA5224765.1 MFS transporter [Streptomyces griseoaurantiacus]